MAFGQLSPYDPHTISHQNISAQQIGVFILWLVSISAWIFGQFRRSTQQDVEAGPVSNHEEQKTEEKNFSKMLNVPSHSEFFKCVVTLGLIMFYFYLCDYLKILPMDKKIYTRDTFLFLVFLLFLAAFTTSVSDTSDKILNRDHTEEWKGWMQVLFVWYHYFDAKEWYNWIRIYIACYVWMTGFGNFSFFWVKGDYSVWRLMKMLFRLNFLVTVVCITVSNDYMLYYICAMHTYWFLSVYVTMAILPSWNKDTIRMSVKFIVYAACNFIIFDIQGVADVVFKPFWFILGLNDGHDSILHEWTFRAGLDHWMCFVGMLCAYNYPHFENFILYCEKHNDVKFLRISSGNWIKAAVGGVVLCVYFAWQSYILPLEKFSYNSIHPYTAFIPVLTYIYFRNVSKALREKYLHLFAWLGKITLETYLSQLHVYLQSNAKNLIGYFHGYPLLNFSFATLIYLPISNALFYITMEISAYLLPKDTADRRRKVISSSVAIVSSFAIGYVIKAVA